VPVTTNVYELIGFFEHLRDLGVPLNRREKPIHVDIAPAPRKRDVIFRCEFLISKEDHSMVKERLPDGVELSIAQVCKVHPMNLSAHSGTGAVYRKCGHCLASNYLANIP